MSNSVYSTILKRATYASTGTIIARISAALAGLIIARTVGPAAFGVYAAVWALIGLSIGFSEIGLTTGLKRDGVRLPRLLPSLLGNALIVKTMLGLFALVIAYFSLSLVSRNVIAPMLFLPLALAGFSALCAEPFFAVLQVKGQQKLVSFFMMGRGLLFLLGIVILASFGFNIRTLAWYQGLLYFTASIVLCFLTIPIVSITVSFSNVLNQIKSSLVFGISEFLFSVYSKFPILFLSHFRTEEEVGFFAVAFRFVSLCLLAGSAASNDAFLPSLFGMYKASRKKFLQICASMQRLFIPLGIFIASALFICSDAIIIILQGEQYLPAAKMLRIMCWVVAIFYGVLASGAALTAGDRMWIKVAFQAIVTIITLGVGFIIIKHYGAFGASYLLVILWLCIMFLYIPYAFRKKLISFSGFERLLAPISLTILLTILTFNAIPNHYLLGPSIFFIGSLFIWGKTAIKVWKKSTLRPNTEY